MAQESIDIRINTLLESAASETNLRKLRVLLRDLQSIGEEIGDTNSEAFNRVAQAANNLEGRIGDANDRLRTITGEPLERVNSGVGLLSEGLSNLDFGKAKIGLDGMADGIKKLSFKEFGSGIKDVTGSFLKLGAAIATNPIFLLGATIVLIIKNFDKLKAAGGAVGAVFTTIGDAIKFATDLMIKFSDSIGLTNLQADDLAKSMKSAADATQYAADKQAELNVELKKLKGESTVWDEYVIKLGKVKQAEEDLNAARKKGEGIIEAEKKLTDAKIEVEKFYGENKIKIDQQIELNDLKLQLKRAENQKKGRQRDLAIAAINRKIDDTQRKKDADKQEDDVKGLNKVLEDANKVSLQQKLFDLRKLSVETQKEQTKLEQGLKYLPSDYLFDEEVVADKMRLIYDNKKKLEKINSEITVVQENLANYSVDVATDATGKIVEDKIKGFDKIYKLDKMNSETDRLSTKKANEERSDINKFYNDKEIDERLKANENLQTIREREFEKEKENIDLEFQDKLNIETEYYYDSLDLLEKNYNLQIQKSGLSEQDKLKLKLDYQKKTEDAYKKHNENLDVIFSQSPENNLKAMAQAFKDTGKDVSSTLEDFNRYREIEQNATEAANAAQLAALQTHLDHSGLIRTRHEKDLIEQLADSRSVILERERQKELAQVGNDANAKLAIEKKYSQLQIQLEEETSAAKIAANVKTIDTIAAYGAQAQDAAQLIMDLGSLKDQERLKKGEITEEQFQKKEFNRKKAANLASIVMNTAEAISKSIALSPATGGLPMSAIAAAIGALQFAKVTSTTFQYASPAQSTSTPSSPSTGGAAANISAPGNPYFGQGFLNLSNFNPLQMGAIKVYVTEQDIRNAMNRVNVINNRNQL